MQQKYYLFQFKHFKTNLALAGVSLRSRNSHLWFTGVALRKESLGRMAEILLSVEFGDIVKWFFQLFF